MCARRILKLPGWLDPMCLRARRGGAGRRSIGRSAMSTPDTGASMTADTETSTVSARAQARKRLEARREFSSHLVAYLVINTFLITTWAFTGAGYFWPAWVLAAWGSGLVMHAWDVFVRRPITQADIDDELRRQHR